MSVRKAAVCVLLLIAAVAVRAEDVDVEAEGEDSEEVVEQRKYGLAGLETVEPMFVEESAEAGAGAGAEVDAAGFPIPLTKRQRRNTVEPRYLGQKKSKGWVAPEYAVRRKSRKSLRRLRNKNKKPRVFKSHYFSPMPKPKKGVRYPPPPGVRRNRRNRRKKNLVPLFSAETPASHHLHKGYVIPEMMNKLPNKYDPIDRSKFTMAPAPSTVPPKPYTTADNAAKANAVPPALVETEAETETESEAEAEAEVDTSAEAEAEFEAENGANPPPFSEEEMGDRHMPTMVESNDFAAEGFTTPDWNDEAAPADFSMSEDALHVEDEEDSADEESEPSLIEAAAHAEDEEESEDEAETEDESEESEEDAEESDSEEEAEEEAEEESEEEADEEESEEGADEIALVESAAAIFGVEGLTADQFNSMDEMAQNEVLVQQVDMDATSDENAARASDEEEAAAQEEGSEEESSEEASEEGESEADTQELEENEMDTNEALAELVETQSLDSSVDTLLAEVDAHITAVNEGESDSESEAESDAEAKGTPGASVGAGMTWDEANANAAEEAEAEEKAAAAAVPKVPAKVVASTADLHNSEPEFDSEPAHVDMAEPQMVDALPEQTAQMVLLEKIAKLKALRRSN